MHSPSPDTTRVGLRANLAQFALLVVLNLFVGGMVGLERTILPLIAKTDFGIASKAAAIAFIATFGITKAVVNFLAGGLADRWGRRRVLVLGWLFGIPVPLIIMFAPSWSWILFANVLLGVNQALAWSMTVVMKVDIAAEHQRGLAIGFNEFAGYAGVAIVAFLTGMIASTSGLRPEPFYLGVGLALAGLVISLLVHDTRPHSLQDQESQVSPLPLSKVFREVTWFNPTLSVSSFAGLVTNLKDGTLWGLLPLFLRSKGLSIPEIGAVVAVYPAVWSITQLGFGPLSDRLGRSRIISLGLALQGVGVLGLLIFRSYTGYLSAAAIIGVGTAMAYPTLLALVSDVAPPTWRASALGVYRFWRDSGFAFGALGAGLVADAFGVASALAVVVILAGIASAAVALRVKELRPL